MLAKQVEFVRNGGETRRYHTWPVLREQTVAEHSFHVAMLVLLLGGPNFQLLAAALTHDLAEWKMGDLPAPAKRNMPDVIVGSFDNVNKTMSFRDHWGAMEAELLSSFGLDYESELTAEEARILKLADAAEGCLHCCREAAMGNRLMAPVFANFREYYADLITDDDVRVRNKPVALLDYIDAQWRMANGG